ncbi:unnamed protein product [Schistocephalus solidus]|uniref:Uncharacterized protein n=1 Tax=Schistocephalus solidus TaxID=70667 RepID=A0A183T1Q7_SCHSO|nr:unnamed protein product [Schistocephalus solidus]
MISYGKKVILPLLLGVAAVIGVVLATFCGLIAVIAISGHYTTRSRHIGCDWSSTAASSTNFQSPSTGLLSRLEASQSSLFRFSTRNMHVNADNSVSPVKPSAQQSSKQQPTTGSGVSSDLRADVRRETKPLQQQQLSSTPALPHVNGDVTWSAEAIQRVRTLLRDYIAECHVNAVNQETAAKICQRALSKITAKPANRVPEAKMKKLVDDYVDFYLRNTQHP